MFDSHNKYTTLAYWLLSISSLVGFIFMGMLITGLEGNQPVSTYALVSVLSLMLLLNTYFAYRIYQRSVSALKWCLWLYGLQIIGFETANWGFSLIFGLQFTITWSVGETSIAFNLMALATWFVVFKALCGINTAGNFSRQEAAGGGTA